MTAKPTKKRPKVRYVAREMEIASGAFNFAIFPVEAQQERYAVALYATPKDAKRIAAALNVYEARRRGEL